MIALHVQNLDIYFIYLVQAEQVGKAFHCFCELVWLNLPDTLSTLPLTSTPTFIMQLSNISFLLTFCVVLYITKFTVF